MISITIGDANYSIPESARDVSVRDYLNYCDVVNRAKSEKLKELESLERERTDASGYRLEQIETKLSELISTYPEHERSYDLLGVIVAELAFWTKAPADLIWQCEHDSILHLHSVLHNGIANVGVDADYSGFTIGADRYALPSEKMADSTLIEFVEAQQLRSYIEKIVREDYGAIDKNSGLPIVSNWVSVLHIACVICRKEGEAYRPNLVTERAEMLTENLTFYDLVQIWFFFLKSRLQ